MTATGHDLMAADMFPGNIDFGALTGYDLSGGKGVVVQKTQYFSSR